MLLKDVDAKNLPPYPVTIEDEKGHPLGWLNGPILTECGASNVGNDVTTTRGVYTVVWDGSKPDPSKVGSTKGRLLPVIGPRYVDSLKIYSYLATESYEEYNDEVIKAEKRASYGIGE